MVRGLLLDTHVLLWWINESHLLSPAASAAILDERMPVYISAASVWEMGIKSSIRKLQIPERLLERVQRLGFKQLDVTARHGLAVSSLPLHHRDPFDRLLIVQAMAGNLTVITRDPIFGLYEVAVLEA